jgi:hypothetical protein
MSAVSHLFSGDDFEFAAGPREALVTRRSEIQHPQLRVAHDRYPATVNPHEQLRLRDGGLMVAHMTASTANSNRDSTTRSRSGCTPRHGANGPCRMVDVFEPVREDLP